ncbi:paxillin-like protein 1 [Aspergillus udagawae]|nr:paxillin-like protein 1 [Aspergillus udagawae]
MAGLMDGALLPTIKCSNCGMSVEISEMGDHICKPTPAPPSPPPPSPPPKSDSATVSAHLRNPSGPRLGRAGPPPRIDPSLANRPYLRPNEDLSKSEKESLTPSPLSVSTGQRSPYLQQRSRISPLLDEPDSPDVIKPVGDLPAFPLPRSMSKKRNASLSQLQIAQTAPPVPSPQFAHAMGGEAPLPPQSAHMSGYERGRSPPPLKKQHDVPPAQAISHRHGESIDSRSSYGTSAGSTRYGENSSKRSTAMSSRRPSFGSIAQESHQFREEASSGRANHLEPLIEHSSSVEQSAGTESRKHDGKGGSFSGFDFGVATAEKPFPDPLRVSSHTNSDRLSSTRGSAELFFRSPSQSSFGLPADWLDPNEARSSSASSANISYKAFRPSGSDIEQPSVPQSEPKSVSRKGTDSSSESNTSVSKFARALGLDFPDHATENSTSSSSESSPSETRSGTSISSLPSEASLSRRKPSETSRLGVVREQQANGNQQPVLPETEQTESPIDLEPPRIPASLFSPDSPTDPAINQGSLSLVVDRAPSSPPQPREPRVPREAHESRDEPPVRPTITRSATEPPVRPPPRSKGRCRGCGEAILGKSVSSKDGRLTGRYHRECFVCCHCRSPFETADFYVLNDHPYCAQHYHELNGSLCSACNKGIEGQYLETNERSGPGPADHKKFHPECLTCRTCWIPVKGEYFEWNGQVYCERDARRAAASMSPHRMHRPNLPSSPLAARPPNYPPMSPGYPRRPGPGHGPGLGPGPAPGSRRPSGMLDVPRGPPPAGARRFPERRTTRLMMA